MFPVSHPRGVKESSAETEKSKPPMARGMNGSDDKKSTYAPIV